MPDGSSGVDHVSDPEDIAEGICLGVDRHAAALGGTYNLAGPANFRYLDLAENLARDLGAPWGERPGQGHRALRAVDRAGAPGAGLRPAVPHRTHAGQRGALRERA